MIRRHDQVIVMSGKEKGKTAKVTKVFPEEGRALLEKLNLVKRHQKPTAKLRQGGIVEKEAPIALSKLMIYCPKCSKGVRIGYKLVPGPVEGGEGGKKVRFCRKCQEVFA
ncbi:MAG: 50S ribosomal protein L24 [Deltaproteobacteria bacterium]|nr:50S ribosomal protein L24 [Deltaproteobacteria bacterium]MBI4374802.1 50S ribosomal protein L24 [Deltaproteobacteria bacterium]